MSSDETPPATEQGDTPDAEPEPQEGGLTDETDDVEKEPLPLPADEEEYRSRFIEYEQEKEDRKTEFLKKSIEGYQTARRMYYHALRQIQFVIQGEEAVRNIFPDYAAQTHKANLKKIVIAMRKIAETCYFLDRFKEGMEKCEEIINIVENHGMSKKMLKLTYGVMGRTMIVKKELNKAREYIDKGLELDPGSGILQKAEEALEKAMKGEDYEDERQKVLRASSRVSPYARQDFDVVDEWTKDFANVMEIRREGMIMNFRTVKFKWEETEIELEQVEISHSLYQLAKKLEEKIEGLTTLKITVKKNIVPLCIKLKKLLQQSKITFYINGVEYRVRVFW